MKSVPKVFDFNSLLTELDSHMKHCIKTLDEYLTEGEDLTNDGVVNEYDYEAYLSVVEKRTSHVA